MATETIEVTGHIVDSLLLAKILDTILEAGCDYEIADVRDRQDQPRPVERPHRGHRRRRRARARCSTSCRSTGPTAPTQDDAAVVAADVDGVLPAGFYSTTNLAGAVRVDGEWLPVENPEMDCGLVVARRPRRTVPMHRIRAGDRVVVGSEGVRVQAPGARPATRRCSSSWRPRCRPRSPRPCSSPGWPTGCGRPASGAGKVLVVAGPAVVHTGGAPDLARLVDAGWVDVLFAGNGFATHDIESNVLGTSLGVSVAEGVPTEGGHANHLRVINEVRRHGSIAAAVEAGFVTGGVMHACVEPGRAVRARRLDPRRRPAARRHHRHGGRRRHHAGRSCPACRWR